jgi:tRNA threonylcarbamoyladenosine biosynthesis protein TsaB
MKVLAVDTSGTSLSLALCEDDKLVAEFNLQQGYNHSVTQMPLLEHMLSVCGVTAGDIDLFTCSIGPGSFTGIRIGVSSVKAMAYALGRPAIGVSSLEALMFPFIKLNLHLYVRLLMPEEGVFLPVYGGLKMVC